MWAVRFHVREMCASYSIDVGFAELKVTYLSARSMRQGRSLWECHEVWSERRNSQSASLPSVGAPPGC